MEISQGKRRKLLNEKRIYGKGDKNIKLLHENQQKRDHQKGETIKWKGFMKKVRNQKLPSRSNKERNKRENIKEEENRIAENKIF